MTICRQMMKWTKCAIRFLRISRPGVRVPSIAPRKTSTRCVLVFLFVCTMEGARTRRRRTAPQAISPVGCCLACGSQWLGMSTVEAVDRKISWHFCFVSRVCTVSARSVLSMSDDVGRCIALQSVPFFASGEQCQAKFCLHFRFEGFFLNLAWIEPPNGTAMENRLHHIHRFKGPPSGTVGQRCRNRRSPHGQRPDSPRQKAGSSHLEHLAKRV